MSEELKPCPFCGGPAELRKTPNMYMVECANAGCGSNPDVLQILKQDAIAAWNCRAPVAARELDVEAERLQTFEQWWATPTTSTAAPYTFMHEQSARAAWLAARSAAQSLSAPVSTEQAGDAWIDLKQRKPRDWEQVLVSLDNGTVTVGMRGSMGWHWEESDAPEDAEATATHWKPWPVAPSPNNSPVGADRRE